MDPSGLKREAACMWRLEPAEGMRVPGIIFATEELLRGMDDKVGEQVANVARLPGIVTASFAMPDAHWGYGFPIGGVAAFDPRNGGVVSAGGVGFDISCGVRLLLTPLQAREVKPLRESLAGSLLRNVPAGVGSTGRLKLDDHQMDAMLTRGARWAVEEGYGRDGDLERIEEAGAMPGAHPGAVSTRARDRQRREMGTLGSGNHYCEVQHVVEVFDEEAAASYGLHPGQVVVSVHCGSRGLGHQIGTEFLRRMVEAAPRAGIPLPDRELACAPLDSGLGREYLGAMNAGINCALANRQIVTHLVRRAFGEVLPGAALDVLFDVSHNTCKEEEHEVGGLTKRLFVHRKGATRAFGPGHQSLPSALRDTGQPVLIGGTMGTRSYVLRGTRDGMGLAFGSSCHGAGRRMSRSQARRTWQGRKVVDDLASRGIIVRSPSFRGVAEEAPDAYKDVSGVVEAAEQAGLSRRVVRLEPLVCVKG